MWTGITSRQESPPRTPSSRVSMVGCATNCSTKHSSHRSLTLALLCAIGCRTTMPSDRTVPSATCRQPITQISAIPLCNGTDRLSCLGAPRPVPLHHRAVQAQMKNGLSTRLDEIRGSRHEPQRYKVTTWARCPDRMSHFPSLLFRRDPFAVTYSLGCSTSHNSPVRRFIIENAQSSPR